MAVTRGQRYFLSILFRFAFYFLISALSVTALVVSLDWDRFTLTMQQRQKEELLRLELALSTLKGDLADQVTNLRTLSHSESLLDYLDHGRDRDAERVEREFLALARSAGIYDQIRLLDIGGRERLRVNFNNGSPATIRADELQDKSQRYYFRETIELAPGGIYVSPLDLNVENNTVEEPFKPTIRLAMPVSDRQGTRKGVLVLNYLAAELLQHFREGMKASWGEVMLVNADGYWLSSPDSGDEWGFMWDNGRTFGARYPDAWQEISSTGGGWTVAKNGAFAFVTLDPYENIRDYSGGDWKLITRIAPAAVAFSPLAGISERVPLFVLIGALSLILAILHVNNQNKGKALRASSASLAEAQQLAQLGNWHWNVSTGEITWSDEVYRIFGLDPQSVRPTYQAFLECVHPDDRGTVADAVEAALNQHRHYSLEHRILRPDGSVRFVQERGKVTFDRSGLALGMLGTVQDITERKQAESALQENSALIRDLYNNAPCGYHSLDKDGTFVQINDTELRWLGFTREELIDKVRFQDLLTPASLERFRANFERFKQRGVVRDLEFEMVRKDGSILPVLLNATAIKDENGEFVMSRSTMFDHSERMKAEQLLREQEERFRQLAGAIDEVFWMTEWPENRVSYVSPAFERIWGISADAVYRDPMLWTKAIVEEDRVNIERIFMESAAAGGFDVVYRIQRRDGDIRWIHDRAFVVRNQNGAVFRIAGVAQDITELTRAEAALKRREAEFRTMVEASPDVIARIDRQFRHLYVSPGIKKVTGLEPSMFIGRSNRELGMPAENTRVWETTLKRVFDTGEAQEVDFSFQGPHGIYHYEWRVFPEFGPDGSVHTVLSWARDVTEQRQAAERLSYLANHDSLTGLPNRLAFAANLEQALQRAKRHNQKLALLFLDLDRFKLINDTMGHEAGDQLLKGIGKRLKNSVRAEDLVARLGGDEFTVLLEEIEHAEDASHLAQKIIEAVAQPVRINERELMTSTSVGISIYPDDAEDAASLAKTADTAMYRAKERGRNTYAFYSIELTAKALEHFALEADLRAALERDELVLHYQPQVDLTSGRIVGVEALARWHHPERGLILPETFIGIAEESGLIRQIGERVFQKACRQAQAWHTQGLGPIRVAINLSGREILHDHLVEMVENSLRSCAVAPNHVQLELEVTESVSQTVDQSAQILQRLRSLGVTIAIDDLGTGYSSLSHLIHLPLDTIKIDRSFVRGVPGDPGSNAITSAIIAMGHALGLRVIAEGVETPQQLVFLKEHGCDEAQGLLISDAFCAEEITDLLRERRLFERLASGSTELAS